MSAPAAQPPALVPLDQRGRAELEFLRTLRLGLAPLRAAVSQAVSDVLGDSEEPSGATDLEAVKAIREAGDGAAQRLPEHRIIGVVLRWIRLSQTPRAVEAFERGRPRLEQLAVPRRDPVPAGSAPVVPPRYWTYEFHGTAGGWDGHFYMGFVHHELIYQYLLAAVYPGDIWGQRATVANAAPRDTYARICDLGCGTGQYTMQLAKTYPQAQITGVDLSASELRYAQRRAENAGLSWTLVQRPAEATGLPDAAFDLVTSFILLHEVPPHATKAILREAYRLLEEDGHIVMSDVVPYRERPAAQVWADDWEAEHGYEPWWRSAALNNLTELLTEVGFVDVQEQGLGPGKYPWVVIGRKPCATQ